MPQKGTIKKMWSAGSAGSDNPAPPKAPRQRSCVSVAAADREQAAAEGTEAYSRLIAMEGTEVFQLSQ
jgi:hypothetical protein